MVLRKCQCSYEYAAGVSHALSARTKSLQNGVLAVSELRLISPGLLITPSQHGGMADALDLGSSVFGRESSSLSAGT